VKCFRSAFIIFCIFHAGAVKAQYNDAGLWMSISIEKKITSSTSFIIQEELRMQENITQAGAIFTDAGFSHKFNKYLSAGINYRFTERRNLDASYSTRHRLYFDIAGKDKFSKFTVTLRERIQAQVRDYHSSENGRIPVWLIRSKLTLKYDVNKKVTPLIATEIFYTLNNPGGNEIITLRYYAGVDYEFNKRHSIQPYYMIQSEKNVNNPATDFVTGIEYSYKF
jgi:hypothetical protein